MTAGSPWRCRWRLCPRASHRPRPWSTRACPRSLPISCCLSTSHCRGRSWRRGSSIPRACRRPRTATWSGWAWPAAVDPNAGPWEWLGDPHVDIVGGGYTVTGWLPRFGTVIVTLQDTRIHGPEAIWGAGYELANGLPVDLDLSLVTQTGATAAAGFSGDWRFGGGYPERIDVVQTTANAQTCWPLPGSVVGQARHHWSAPSGFGRRPRSRRPTPPSPSAMCRVCPQRPLSCR